MELNLTDQSRWGIATIFLVVGTVLFVAGWTSPFLPAPESLLWMKTVFPFVASIGFIILFFMSLWILSKTTPPPTKPQLETEAT